MVDIKFIIRTLVQSPVYSDRRDATMQSTDSRVAGDHTIVFFDLETTGLDTSACDITQLSAVSGERTFNAYTVPRCKIADEASRITGLTVQDQILLHHGQPVPTVPLGELLSSFISFLLSFPSPPLLAAHNAKRFDCPVLCRALDECSLRQRFQQAVSGCLDTFLMSKALFADLGLPKHSQEFLVSHFLCKSYNAHDALEDVRALQELYQAWSPGREVVGSHTFPL